MFPSKENKLLYPYLWKEIQSQGNLASYKDVPSTKKESSSVKRKPFDFVIIFISAAPFSISDTHMLVHLPNWSRFQKPLLLCLPCHSPVWLILSSFSAACSTSLFSTLEADCSTLSYLSDLQLSWIPSSSVKAMDLQTSHRWVPACDVGQFPPPSLGQESLTLFPKTPQVQCHTH